MLHSNDETRIIRHRVYAIQKIIASLESDIEVLKNSLKKIQDECPHKSVVKGICQVCKKEMNL